MTNSTTSSKTSSKVPSKTSSASARSLDPLAVLCGLRLESGQTWGSVAHRFQLDDAHEILDQSGPRRHVVLRGRGMSKTTDVAGLALALLLAEAPPLSKSYVFAADGEQAALTMDALRGLADRSSLASMVELGARSVTVKDTGATLDVMTSDGASAYGLRPWLCIVDELPMWPSTSNHRALWAAIVSATAKVPGARLVVIGTAGSPVGLGHDVYELAVSHPEHWRVVTRPGPSPWWSHEDVEATRASLTPAEYRRLILCEWAEGDDNLTDPQAVADAVRPADPVLPYSPSAGPYVLTLDVGTRRDLTAVVVAHSERRPAGRVVVIDRVVTWRPSRQSGGRVDLAEVQDAVERLAREYHAPVHFDRMQAEMLTTNLQHQGIITHEYVFSSAGANKLARSLYIALRDRALSIPDDPELIDGLNSTRMVETGPGTVKLQNPVGHHDDTAVVAGMAVALLTERSDVRGGISVPSLDLLPTYLKKPSETRTRASVARAAHHHGVRAGGPGPDRVRHALRGLRGGPDPLGPTTTGGPAR